MKKILLLNDLPGFGKVALSAMIPILTGMKYDVFNLPTALVSNTLNYGKVALLDTGDYIQNAVNAWEQLRFTFDAVSTGFLASDGQVEMITDICRKYAGEGSLLFTDPIMADNGRLYNGITPARVDAMKKLISIADYIFPNYTEASLLADFPYETDGTTAEQLMYLVDRLRDTGAKSVVITSCRLSDTDTRCVFGYDAEKASYFRVDYAEFPLRVPGAGDAFAALVIGKVMAGIPLETAVAQATETLCLKIAENKAAIQNGSGILW